MLATREDLENTADYIEVSHQWGYKAAPVHCAQQKMYIVYQFDFQPYRGKASKDDPPVTIEVPAQDLGEELNCSPE
jgi:hypothetical protein